MKKTILLSLLLLSFIGVEAQKSKYYLITVSYKSTDGCTHANNIWYSNNVGGTESFEDAKASIKKYIKPFKIVGNTFKITGYQQITWKIYRSLKQNKFEPCGDIPQGKSGEAVAAIQGFYRTLTLQHDSALTPILSVSPSTSWDVDSAKTYTVQFSKSKVHFLNDSTFTFKLK